MQVPTEGASRPLTSSISTSSMSPARIFPTTCGSRCTRRASRRGDGRPPSVRPAPPPSAGRRCSAPMICAGSVLSQPPITTTASIGCARTISSVSIAIRLRSNMQVGCAKFVDADGRKHHRQCTRQHHAALDRFDQLRHVAVAGIVVAGGVGDADNRTIERVIGIADRLDGRSRRTARTRRRRNWLNPCAVRPPSCWFLVALFLLLYEVRRIIVNL